MLLGLSTAAATPGAATPEVCSSSRRSLLDVADWTCTTELPVLCGPESYGTCVASIEECTALLGSCSSPDLVRCADGTCTSSAASCISAAASCITGIMCPDGSCEASADACGAVPGCPVDAPLRCADGGCASDASSCATLYPCAPGRERCADGQCALEDSCANSNGCDPSLPLLCADRHCYAAGADCALGCLAGERCLDGSCSGGGFDCPDARWEAKPPRFSLLVLAGVEHPVDLGEVGSLTLPANAFGSDVVLSIAPVADSVLKLAEAPHTWADWQRSIFSAAVHVAASEGSAAPAVSLPLTLEATLPFQVAVTDTCLGQLLQLDATRRLWRCAPGGTLSFDAGTAGSSAGTTYSVSASLTALGTYAIIYSDSTTTEHPNLADVTPPPPPPPGSAAAAAATNATEADATSSSGSAGFNAYVAIFSILLLTATGLVGCVGLCVAGSPMRITREEEEEGTGNKVHPLFPGMPGYVGE